MANTYFIYILSSKYGVLYTGVTNNLERRVHEHKTKLIKGFTSKYNTNRLVYFEEFDNIQDARDAERMIKGWTRKKKLDLIREKNPKFIDLGEDGKES